MKKGIKLFCKILSIFLAFLFVMEILPLQVMAEEFTDAVAHKEFIENLVNNPADSEKDTEAEVLYEVEEKRDEYTKVYKKSDGTYTAVMTEEPMHYLNNGVWEEIDNSIILNGSLYTNLSNLFNVELPENIDENKNLTVEKDGYELSFSVNDIENSSAVVENNIAVSDTEITDADVAIAQTQSAVTYNNVAENTDLQYIITPNSIKENIIISNKESVKDTYTFTFEANGLNAEKQNDGSVLFKDNDGDVKFKIPRPVMTDTEFAFSYDISVSLTENSNGTVCLTYSPSNEWISSSDRVYPIVIDPAIFVNNSYGDWAEDVCVIDDSTNETDQGQNSYNDYIGMVANSTTTDENGAEQSVNAEIYTKINTDSLKLFGKNFVVTEAQYLLAGSSANGKALAKKISEPVDLTTVTYNTKPALENEAFDYYTAPYVTGDDTDIVFAHFNITKPLNEWLDGAVNNGFAIVTDDPEFISLFYMNGVFSYTNPQTGAVTTRRYSTAMCFDFVDVGGYNAAFEYHSQSAGRAGTGYVNDFTQSLSVIRNDLSLDGNIMPVTVGMIYDSAIYSIMEAFGASDCFVYGNGWSPNYMRAFLVIGEGRLTYYTDSGASIDFDYTEDENGVWTFNETNIDIYGESGYTIEHIAGTGDDEGLFRVTCPDGNVESFNSGGMLTSVCNPDYPEQNISVVYETVNSEASQFDRIDYITDGVGRKFDYIYNEATGLLSKIKCYSANGTAITAGSTASPLEVNYTYDTNGYLTSVTYPDGKSVTYSYDSNGNMTSMENIDGYRVVYEYDSNGRITKITEQAKDGTDYINGNYITYDRLGTAQVKLTDALGNFEIYQFNSCGKLLYTTDSNGNYLMADSPSADSTYFVSASGYKPNSENLLKNSGFEGKKITESRADYWENTNSAFERSQSPDAHLGQFVCAAVRTSEATVYQKQTVEVLSGGTYTLSAFVKSDETNIGKLYLRITALNGSNTKTKTECITVESTGGEWQRYSVTFDAPETTKRILVEFGFENSKGTYYIDDLQLEQSASASPKNFIENGGFRSGTDGWTASESFTVSNTAVNSKNSKAVVIPGGSDSKTLYQTIEINGKKDDVFTAGGWWKGSFVNSSTTNAFILSQIAESADTPIFNFTNDRYAQLEISYQYTAENENGESEELTETVVIPFAQNLDGWQFAAQSFALKGDCDEITVLIRYSKHLQGAMVSNIELTMDEDAVVLAGSDEAAEEETETCPCESCEEADCACACESESICACVACKRRSGTTVKDAFGNTVSTGSFDGVKRIQTLAQYTNNGNYPVSETDADGNTVTYNYNELNGVLNAVTDARGNETAYNYNAAGQLIQVSAGNLLTSSANYVYNNDRLTSISHNGFAYNISYNIWGQPIMISVGTQPIISYTYGENEYRDRVVSSTYHNSDGGETVTEYYYDLSGNITEITVNGETKFNYSYDSLGSLTEISAADSRIVRYTDGRTDILDFSNNYIYSSYTNDDGDFVEIIGGVTYTSKSYDSAYDITTGTTTEKSDVTASNGKTIGTVDKQDWFGRYTESVIKTESANDTNDENTFAAVKTEYTYPEYADNKTSNRVESYVNKVYYGTDTDNGYTSYTGYSYDYDANGNITAEYSLNAGGTETLRYGYVYDELNQLVRVNDAVAQKTYTYTYDGAGNILAKTTYPYTTGDLGTANGTVNYTYDSTWKDKLVSYGNTSLTYDNVGNPLTIGDKSFTWSGRQLETYVDGNKTIEFEYDENGLRHRKTVKENGVITERYDYVWANGSLVSQTYTTYSNGTVNTSNTAKFIYDTWGTLQGFVLNDTATYLYTKNLQGDITSIVNENGQTILNYSYDAWGAVTFSATSMQNMLLAYTLSYVSPFTYRGYCYDYDIELYYLQSRYYSAEIGRFINTDDTQIAIATQGEVLGANLFAYCNNEPVMFVDYDGYYNRKKAVSYAKRWAYFRNPLYRTYGQDCANFVSQCLAAGGIKTNNMWHNELLYVGAGMFNRGELVYDVTNNWSTVRGLMNYFVNFQKYCAQISACYFLNRNGNANTMIKDFISFSNKIQVGDIMLMDTHIDGKEAYNHATIITKITNNEIYYTAHSKNRLDAKLSEKVSSKSIENIYVISLKNSAV